MGPTLAGAEAQEGRPAQDAPAGGAQETPSAQPRINTTGRRLALSVPLKDGALYLGDIPLSIDAEDRITTSSARLVALLTNVLDARTLSALRATVGAADWIGLDDLNSAGLVVRYDPRTIELIAEISARTRQTRAIQVSPLGQTPSGEFEEPAALSAFLNVRGAINYVERGKPGGASAVMLLDAATRFGGVVLETQGVSKASSAESSFQRNGSRLILDDQKRALRWTLGDLEPAGRGLQTLPRMAGLSVLRSYGLLQPEMVTRPTGRESFELERPSTVEVEINGHVVRRLFLDPGSYDLQDFPFTRGVNDVRLSIRDDTGRAETLRFSAFSDDLQLAAGLSEFGAFAGVEAPLGRTGPNYSGDWLVTGFYRRGLFDGLTLGGNLQADARTQMGGIEILSGTPLGGFGAQLAASSTAGVGSGFASILTLEHVSQQEDAAAQAFELSLETWTRDFSALGALSANPYEYRVEANYSRAFTDDLSAGLAAHYAAGRDDNPGVTAYRATMGWRLSSAVTMTADASYQEFDSANKPAETAFRISFQVRLGPRSSIRAEHDTQAGATRISYQRGRGGSGGDGSYSITADVERASSTTGINATLDYFASEGELGFDHFASFGGEADESRSAFRFGTALAFADGAVSVGRPIYDSFAIFTGHRSLGGAEVLIDPTPNGFGARTGFLGTAIKSDLSSYSERTIAIDAPEAPAGIDLGSGTFRVFPPYRSGYRLQVGSDYSITLVGRLIDGSGAPLSLLAGQATENAHPERAPVELFTNRLGRFGIAGLKPGRWRIDMYSDPVTSYVIDIPLDVVGAMSAGDLRPAGGT